MRNTLIVLVKVSDLHIILIRKDTIGVDRRYADKRSDRILLRKQQNFCYPAVYIRKRYVFNQDFLRAAVQACGSEKTT